MGKDAGPLWPRLVQNDVVDDATAGVGLVSDLPEDYADDFAVIDDLVISTKTSMDIIIKTKTTETVLLKLHGFSGYQQFTLRNGLVSPDAGEGIRLVASVAGEISFYCSAHIETIS